MYSRYTRFPSNIHFYCCGNIGGATPIAHSANVFEKVESEIPELVEEIHKRGLGMKMVFRAPGDEAKVNPFNWAGEHSFGQELLPGDDEATTRQKVEQQVRKLTPDFKWKDDGSLELTQHIPDIPCIYGGETPIPRQLLDKLIEVIDKEEINLVMEEGDLLFVDNFQVSHGRQPWEGDRLVLVSMWDTESPIGVFDDTELAMASEWEVTLGFVTRMLRSGSRI
ncbi:taurine catabolism dioxygenase TauD/TfdA [Colletotrichum graminicola M1.001]|uniref:Taurine catabolism dioxygenase TauD/TfdA n=1 Tax=Colletotrichum graminicola (strain M1.001 / M2 / FGSC 10212) TaxID=645133 RepID=E3QYX8_COLGM|nr:taurine catabolism dioxygenase TauD/TfdA [Colletotrichum graminicola M1.001]EFQ36066.1 taurine catabolism dioxygenase TauD/TfdA [Colletotrichum graminicola M1.001]